MNLDRFYILLSTLLFLGCKTPQKITASAEVINSDVANQVSSISIKAIDLSEDMSRFSTKNDELLLLMYSYAEGKALEAPLISEYFVMDSLHINKTFIFEQDSLEKINNILIFLLEIDSDKSIEEIEPVVRVHYQTLFDAYKSRSWKNMQNLLGDDDVLGCKIISSFKQDARFNFSGIQRMDRYDFEIGLSAKNQQF